MNIRRARAACVGLLVAATAVTAGPAVAAPAAVAQARALGAATTVTLLTGDLVTLGGPTGADVVAAKGREHIGFRTYTEVDGDVTVIPEDALAGVASGQLDRRLFDVSELARSGYGDVDRKDVPLIVDYPGATPRVAGTSDVRELPSMGAVAMRAEKGPAFWSAALTSASKIWLDGRVTVSLDHSAAQIGAPDAWAAGHTGAGTKVAVLDTGIDATHPDLDDAVVGAQNFTPSAAGTTDRFGHGTHVASTITGSGDRYKGVAPDAKLLNGKVLDDGGGGQESWIIAGMEWAAANGADVVNMSLGTWNASDGTDPMSQAVNRITAEKGTLFVIAAGNNGPDAVSVGSPGAADAALTVGAVDRDDKLAGFSSRGPRIGDGAIKPDITAPGVDIVAARAAGTSMGSPVNDRYTAASGTSMATPHVAGAAAILAGVHPDWGPELLKSTLMGSAEPADGLSAFEQGAGRVDVAAAVGTQGTVSAAPASMGFGTVLYPHHDDQPITKKITYRNSGAAPVTLDVTVEMDAPAGLFTVSPSQVTVPAGGVADVSLTADTRVAGAEGVFSGTVVAAGGNTRVRVPIALESEVESYNVTFKVLDHNGNPTSGYDYRLVDLANPRAFRSYDPSGTSVVRVPKGTYFLDGHAWTNNGQWPWPSTDFTEPALVVDRDTEFTLDARDGVPVALSVDQAAAAAGSALLDYRMTTEWGLTGSGLYRTDFRNLFSRPSRTSSQNFDFEMRGEFARPDGTGTWPGFHASPYLFHVAYAEEDSVPADLTHVMRRIELAKVVSTHAVATPDRIGVRDSMVSMPLPYTLTEYYSPGVDWRPYFQEAIPGANLSDGFSSSVFSARTYQAGTVYQERWNVGVFGPGLASAPDRLGEFARLGDEFQASIAVYGDQNTDANGYFWTVGNDRPGSTQLLRDGAVISDEPYPGTVFRTRLPAEEAIYTLRTSASKPGPLSTRVDAEWTFRSGHVAGDTPTPIPALAVRLAPNLDDHNAAPAGRFRFPVHTQRNGVDEPGQVNPPLVEVSYNDGGTWQRARLIWSNGKWQAEVNNPVGAQFASLRWSVSDNAGNSAKATIIHAYALK
ncbi:S8 family peptidase [Actinophytocola sp.]|uniref:S8 family peptidase n=1 Tax=Actinophytocola sp. TaxID=1872138 RepID=UPI002ED1B8A9